MHATRSVVLALVLFAGCGGPSRGSSSTTAAAGGGALDPTVSQSERAATFPTARTDYWCQWLEDTGYAADKHATAIEVTPAAIRVHAHGTKDEWTSYPIDGADAAYVIPSDGEDEEQRSFVLGDGLLYMVVEAGGGGAPEVQFACAVKSEQQRITGVRPAAHRERLQAYADGRREAFLATAGDVEVGDLDLGDVDLGDVDGGDDDADDDASRWTAEQAAQIARARTMESFTFEASVRDRNAHPAVVVIATLADGSTMRIGRGDPIFPALFGVSIASGETSTMVDVWPLDEEGAEIKRLRQYQEVAYQRIVSDFEGGSESLRCEGKAGEAGIERNWNDNGRLYYRGQPGESGPAITVEITTMSASRPDTLRYRLRCGKQEKVFYASASTEVTVTTVGGDGGYGIEKGNGDGSSGGDGGDGGDITVLVDPSVGSYRLTTVSRGGKGGNPSRQSNGSFAKGNRGRDGSEGSVDERREPVTIP